MIRTRSIYKTKEMGIPIFSSKQKEANSDDKNAEAQNERQYLQFKRYSRFNLGYLASI